MNIVTMYDGTQKDLPKGVKLLSDVAIGQQGACCVCGEVLTKATAMQNKHGNEKPECRNAYNARSRRKAPEQTPATPARREAANHGNPDAPLQPGEWQRLRSIVRKAGLSLGDHNKTDRYYLVLDRSNNPQRLDYETARMWCQSPEQNQVVLVEAWLGGRVHVNGRVAEQLRQNREERSSSPTRPATSLKLAVARVMVAADSLEQRRAKLAQAAALATEAELELANAALLYDLAVEEARAAGVFDQEVGLALAEVSLAEVPSA